MSDVHTKEPWEINTEDVRELAIIGYEKIEHQPNTRRKDGLWPQRIVSIKAGRKGAKRGGFVRYLPFSEKEKANIRRICQCVNNFDELLEACKNIRNAFNLPLRTVEDFDILLKNQLPMIEQAIAKTTTP